MKTKILLAAAGVFAPAIMPAPANAHAARGHDLVETREGSCVKGADPAEADDADSHSHQSSPPMTI